MVKSINIIELNHLINKDKLNGYRYTFILFGSTHFSKSQEKRLDRNNVAVFCLDKNDAPLEISSLSPHLEYLLNNINGHGLLMIHEGKDHYYPLEKSINITHFINSLFSKGFLGLFKREPVTYAKKKYSKYVIDRYNLIHLSDLHFGNKKISSNISLLESSIEEKIDKLDKFRFLITGDLKDSPNVSFTNIFFDFKAKLDREASQETLYVLGNHDVNNRGTAILPGKRGAVESLGMYPDIKVDNDNKLIYILLNSNVEGALFARGKIGKNQFQLLETKYGALKKRIDTSKYQKIIMLHHHVFPINNPGRFKSDSWWKKYLLKDKVQLLIDSKELIAWMKKEDIKYVLHGHRHIPNYEKYEGINVISCGSSTGADVVLSEENVPAMSYNVLSLNKENPCCLIYYIIDETHQNVIVYPIN